MDVHDWIIISLGESWYLWFMKFWIIQGFIWIKSCWNHVFAFSVWSVFIVSSIAQVVPMVIEIGWSSGFTSSIVGIVLMFVAISISIFLTSRTRSAPARSTSVWNDLTLRWLVSIVAPVVTVSAHPIISISKIISSISAFSILILAAALTSIGSPSSLSSSVWFCCSQLKLWWLSLGFEIVLLPRVNLLILVDIPLVFLNFVHLILQLLNNWFGFEFKWLCYRSLILEFGMILRASQFHNWIIACSKFLSFWLKAVINFVELWLNLN